MSQPKESAGFRHLTTHRLAEDNIVLLSQPEQTPLLLVRFLVETCVEVNVKSVLPTPLPPVMCAGSFWLTLGHAQRTTTWKAYGSPHQLASGTPLALKCLSAARRRLILLSWTLSPRPTASQLFEELPQCLCACVKNDSHSSVVVVFSAVARPCP